MFLESAQYSYRAIGSRYGSGLATYADLIQTQYTLLRAETEQKLYYMAVWKAWLYKAAVAGDLNLFINRIN
jgi:outer membrane protein TolC